MPAAEISFEAIRLQHRPHRTQLLFIGESPPAGGKFFYQGDSGLNLYTRQAFAEATGRDFNGPEDFLRFFVAKGCYLEDLCPLPVNNLKRRERRANLREAVPAFAGKLQALDPEILIVIMRAIRRPVTKAIVMAALQSRPIHFLCFPSHSHQGKYVAGLKEVLQKIPWLM